MNIDTNDLLLFRTLYETQSLTIAAERLNLSLSKASRMLASLRKELEDDLFNRYDHQMYPTPRAKDLYPKVLSLLQGFSSLTKQQSFSERTLEQTFSIGGIDNALVTYIGPCLSELSLRAPNIKINFHHMSRDPYSDLQQGIIDIAIYATNEAFPGFQRLELCQDVYVYICRSASRLGHFAASGKPLSERMIKSAQKVQITLPKESADDSGTAPFIESFPENHGSIQLATPFFVSAPYLLYGESTVCIPFQAARLLQKTFPLTILGRSKTANVFSPTLIWSDKNTADPAHQWLRSFLASEIKHHATPLDNIPVLDD